MPDKVVLMEKEVVCDCCGMKKVYHLRPERVLAWRNGMPIQDALPELSIEDREFLISGLCPDCWDALWEDEEDEDDE